MATPTDPTFGAGFDAAAFRAAITSTMEMGMPADDAEKATFRWHPQRSFGATDADGRPYSWSDTPTSELLRDDVIIPVAVEFSARPAATKDEMIGQFDGARAALTVLDTHYPQVEDANLVLFQSDVYEIDFWGPPVGLFSVTVYTAFLTARDES